MAVTHPHSKLITTAARRTLRPLGMVQKGGSRTWVDDHGWWLGLVEFQPSRYSRGSYLNVGANWLWKPRRYLFCDYGGRVHFQDEHGLADQYVQYENDEQFAPLADTLATLAAEQILHYRELFAIASTAAVLRRGERAWFDAGIALGLAGDDAASRAMFARHIGRFEALRREGFHTESDTRDYERARLLSDLAPDHNAFCDHIREDVTAARSLLKLEARIALPF